MQDGREHDSALAPPPQSPHVSPHQPYTPQFTHAGSQVHHHVLPYSATAYPYPISMNMHHIPPVHQASYDPPESQASHESQPPQAGPSNTSRSTAATTSRSRGGGKTFTCTGYQGCSMSFSRSEHLARHVRKHTGEKPFTCRCGKKFTRLDNLRQHASTIHSDEPEANEELFARLAAHMPRSGRAARQLQASSKSAGTSPETSFSSPSASSTHFAQPSNPQQPEISPQIPRSSSIATLEEHNAHASTAASVPGLRPMHSLPRPLPSPSFRFSASASAPPTPAPYNYTTIHHYHQVDQQLPLQWSPVSHAMPQEHFIPSHAPEQQLNTQNTLHPSQAQHGGRGGNSFRVGQLTYISPTGIEYTGANTPILSQKSSSVKQPVTGSPAWRPNATFSTRPVLPSLSSLIAGEPLPSAASPSFGTPPFPMHSFDDRLAVAEDRKISTILTVGTDLAVHRRSAPLATTASPHMTYDSRSSSFSASSSSTSAGHTAATSPPPLTSPCSPVLGT
ncbi:hypothetical protein P389DRAFT_181063 [Cystobasidium minutum MCA 4210]|uniref:uncharacterized protein n=1 Tax=Cystobasidium minutum MCA 4210 TaxID=1397322 RepID=UPI0034CD7E93|eukprot:jgi/Rhomi1/181063/fgenesh1_pg.5_\